MSDTPKIILEYTNKWILRNSKNEYVIDWTKQYNQYPDKPTFSINQLQKLLKTSDFIPITKNDNFNPFNDVIVIPKLDNNIGYLKVVKHITILDIEYEYMFLFECSCITLKLDDLMFEKYNELVNKYNSLNDKLNELINENKVNTAVVDIMNTIEINNSTPTATIESVVTRYICNKEDMLKYHKFLIEELKCSTYINSCQYFVNNRPTDGQRMNIYNNNPDIFTFGENYYFYKFVDNHLHGIDTTYNKNIRTSADDSKLLQYIGIMFTYLSKYNNYDIISFKIIRTDKVIENKPPINKSNYILKLEYQYKINNNRKYFERYYLHKCESFYVHEIDVISTNNYITQDTNDGPKGNANLYGFMDRGNNYKILNLFKIRIN